MKRRYFHGTSKASFENMLKTNFGVPEGCVWDCSDDVYIYLYDIEKAMYNHWLDDEEEAVESCIREAFQSAQIACAVGGVTESEIVVLELLLDDEDVEDDNSFDRAEDMYSCINHRYITTNNIVKVHKLPLGYLPSLRLFYLTHLGEDVTINTEHLTEIELEALEVVKNTDVSDLFEKIVHDAVWEWETTECSEEV